MSVNNGIASPANGATNWTSTILLRPGANVIRAVAVDAAGNFSLPASIHVSFIPAVSNDLFVNATPLAGSTGTNLVSTIQATKEPGEPQFIAENVGGKSVWWTYTPATTGVLTLSTTNSTFDTIMALYTSDNDTTFRITNLVVVASNDDAYNGVTFSKISQAVSNRTYWILVDGFNGASGNANLTYSFASSNIFHLTVNTIESGTVVPPSGDFADGSTVVLAATPDPNYEFVEWVDEGISSIANPLSIVVNANLFLTARFRAHVLSNSAVIRFSDPEAPYPTCRFYRAVSP